MSREYRYCSGILPYTYFNQSIYYLLGKSKRNNRLTTFSGKNDDLESNPADTAAREGYEETLGCILDKAALLERINRCDEQKIIFSATPRGMPCYTYLIEVPFRKHYTLTFHKTKEFLMSMGIRSYALQEMTDIKWVCAKTMFTRIRKTWERSGILRDEQQWNKILTLVKTTDCEPISISANSWRRDDSVDSFDPTDDEELESALGSDELPAASEPTWPLPPPGTTASQPRHHFHLDDQGVRFPLPYPASVPHPRSQSSDC